MSAVSSAPTPSPTDWRAFLTPDRLLPGIIAGLVVSIINISLAVAYATFVFSGHVPLPYLYEAIGIIMVGTLIFSLVIALSSSFSSTIACPQETPAAILALLAAVLAEELVGIADAETRFFTLLTLIMSATLITGATFWLLGHFRLGNLVRYVPYPVVGGFLAGTGLLLLLGGVSIMAGVPVNYRDLSAPVETEFVVLWLPGAVFGMVLYVMMKRYSHHLLIPAAILAAIVLFYLVLMLTGTSIDEATAEGWLLQAIPEDTGMLWHPITPSDLDSVQWSEILHHLPSLLAVAMVSVLAALLNMSGLGLSTDADLDINHELKSLGLANGLAGFTGSIPGFHTLSDTVLVHKISGGSRLPGIMMALVTGVVVVAGASLVGYFPRLVLGGLLILLGLDFLYEWAIKVYHEMRLAEYAVVVTIALAINTVGFLEGVGLGLMFAVILFVMDYSRTPVVFARHDGVAYRSNVVRSIQYADILHEYGQQVMILRLRGHLFFGTAHQLLDHVRQRQTDPQQPPLRHLLLDFRRVTGIDSSALIDFRRIIQLAQVHDLTLILTDLSPDFRRILEPHILSWEGCHAFADLDHGVEWVEDQIITEFATKDALSRRMNIPLAEQLDAVMPLVWSQRLMQYMEREEAQPGQVIIRQGEPSPGVLFVEEGQVTIQLEGADGSLTRIRTMRQGTLIGEIGVYLDQPATASVVADVPCVLYRMKSQSLTRLKANDPAVAGAFHYFMARFLARRLTQTTETLSAFVD